MTDSLGRWQHPEVNTFNTFCTFMRCPPLRRDEETIPGVTILGVPFDLGTTYRPGARFGPSAIRAASAQLARRKMFPWGFNPSDVMGIKDGGDLQLDIQHPENIYAEIVEGASALLARGGKLLTLGGDHYVSYPLLAAHFHKYGTPLRLLHFDAHTDTWPDPSMTSISHGTMFYKAVHAGFIDVEHSVQVGIRTWNDDTLGIHQISAVEFHEMRENEVIARIRSVLGDGPVYLTFDIDCLDPAYAPGTGTPVIGGLSTPSILAVLRGLAGLHFIGADVVEVAPAYDHGEITAIAGAQIAAELLCLFSVLLERETDQLEDDG
ncbi:agmatinase [Acidithiobacillus sp. AMEEHan]|uniref:agmatinase n=1 Tax=Acidithiobacillus sp. AMEEHan TaxID=2994951 RepID=UPI0027E3D0A9|nr:agmatinase [Acidithiobacillus sp. AMEEHan]